MLYETRQYSLFWDYIPEAKLCFCVNLCRPSGPYSIRPIQKLLISQTTTRFIPMGSNQKHRCGSEVSKWQYTKECADEWWQNNADLKLLKNCVMNGFIVFGIMFMTSTGLENSPQSFDVYTVSQSRSVVTSADNPSILGGWGPITMGTPKGPRELASVNWRTPPIYKNYYTRLFRKMALYKILIHVSIV